MQWRPHIAEGELRRAVSKDEVPGFGYTPGDRAGTVTMHGAATIVFMAIKREHDAWDCVCQIMVPKPRVVSIIYQAKSFADLHRQWCQDGKNIMLQSLREGFEAKDKANGKQQAKDPIKDAGYVVGKGTIEQRPVEQVFNA